MNFGRTRLWKEKIMKIRMKNFEDLKRVLPK
jgi:hypothetical protein